LNRTLQLLSCASLVAGIGLQGSNLAKESSPRASRQDDSIVGTWRLLSYEDWDKSGRRTVPFGEHPRGYIVFDPTGHVTIQIMRMPALPPLASGDEEVATPGEKQAAYDAYAAYFGTYTVRNGQFVTHVEGSLRPTYTNTDQPRPFTLTGDRLIIGDQKRWKRVLQRVR
jgi:Lipocalin-like domain